MIGHIFFIHNPSAGIACWLMPNRVEQIVMYVICQDVHTYHVVYVRVGIVFVVSVDDKV